jgi:bifunctional non-homologous end joining protein LigD
MAAKTTSSQASTVANVHISHPDRLIYPDQGISKVQLARYYDSIAEWIVPHVKARPLKLVHCPAGRASPCIYLKHAKQWGPSALRRVKIQEKTRSGSTSSPTGSSRGLARPDGHCRRPHVEFHR